jgi:hypothetical protein
MIIIDVVNNLLLNLILSSLLGVTLLDPKIEKKIENSENNYEKILNKNNKNYNYYSNKNNKTYDTDSTVMTDDLVTKQTRTTRITDLLDKALEVEYDKLRLDNIELEEKKIMYKTTQKSFKVTFVCL